MSYLHPSKVYRPVIKHLKNKYSVIKQEGTNSMIDVFDDWLVNRCTCKPLINSLMDRIKIHRNSFDKVLDKSLISKYIITEKIDYENYDSVCLAAKFYGTDLENFIELVTCVINKDLIKTKFKKWGVKHLYEKVIYLVESVVLLTIGKLFYYLQIGSIIDNISIRVVDNVTLVVTQQMRINGGAWNQSFQHNLPFYGQGLTYDNLQEKLSEDFLREQKKKYKHQKSTNCTFEEWIMESIQKISNFYSSVVPTFFPINEKTIVDDLTIFPEILFENPNWQKDSLHEICDMVDDPYILFVMNRFYKKNINLISQLKPEIIPVYNDVLVLEI